MVLPRNSTTKQFSKINSDMTMIMPKFKKVTTAPLNEIQEESHIKIENEVSHIKSENEMHSTAANPFVEVKSEDDHMKIGHLFSDSDVSNKSVLLPAPDISSHDDAMDIDESGGENQNPDENSKIIDNNQDKLMSDTTPDMNQLSISDERHKFIPELKPSPEKVSSNPPSPPKSSNEIMSIIESSDPLSSLTKGAEKIQIYEDDPKAIDSLLGFETYIYRNSEIPAQPSSADLLEKLHSCKINNLELMYLMKSIESQQVNIKEVESGLLKYLQPTLDQEHIQIGIILLHSCLLTGEQNQTAIFEKLLELGLAVKSNEDELFFAIRESFEMLNSVSLYVSALATKKCLTNLQQELLLESIYSLMGPTSLSSEDIFNLDIVLYKLAASKFTCVRKLTVMIYAKFLKFQKANYKDSGGNELIDDLIFKRLAGDKMKLVEYYVDRV
ncbi:unnamed protein product [Ambrosiozyma monospora]|uniref:Unnamed protein product n=1 Tax=Ambrosiozyma monospora TaxID=43982 RepID=A0ACB5TQL8_AMBMO|nr:unnamed protein product [Ambrosiozyma monospora]